MIRKYIAASIAAITMIAVAGPAGARLVPNNEGKFHWGEERQSPRIHYRTYPRTQSRSYYKKRTHHARRHHRKARRDANSNKSPPWNMVKVKTVQGLYLTVHPAYAHKFLRLFEILDQNGVNVPKGMVGCYARGHHVSGSNHYIGAACDIQTGWNRTIPAMYHAGKWIKQAGLYDGCDFGDCGHVEAIKGTHNARKLPNIYAALAKFKADESTANYQP